MLRRRHCRWHSVANQCCASRAGVRVFTRPPPPPVVPPQLLSPEILRLRETADSKPLVGSGKRITCPYPREASVAIALFGTAVLAGSGLAAFRQTLGRARGRQLGWR